MAASLRRSGLQVSVTDARGRPVAAHGLARWLARAAPARARGSVSIALIGDSAMRRLNRHYRGADYATDVLSFPQERPQALGLRPQRRKAPGLRPEAFGLRPQLGDIAIATGVARRQAAFRGHSVAVELRILALHGLLHLLGYDHETDQGEMGKLEDRLRRRAGLPVGLTGRTPGRASRR